MKSQENHKYAVIVDGKVHQIFDAKDMIAWCECGKDNVDKNGKEVHPHCILTLDITNKPGVKIGDLYKDINKLFNNLGLNVTIVWKTLVDLSYNKDMLNIKKIFFKVIY